MSAWYSCGFCGARYRNRMLAQACCGGEFDDDGHDTYGEAPPAGVPPERYAYEERLHADGGEQ